MYMMITNYNWIFVDFICDNNLYIVFRLLNKHYDNKNNLSNKNNENSVLSNSSYSKDGGIYGVNW